MTRSVHELKSKGQKGKERRGLSDNGVRQGTTGSWRLKL